MTLSISFKKKLPYYAMTFSVVLCLMMGAWWLYLLAKLGATLQVIAPAHLPSHNIYQMIIAEGATFFLLLLLVFISIYFLIKFDQRKMSALQRFNAIFSHELKTPLTTLQLQIELLPELLVQEPIDQTRIQKTLTRLASAHRQLKNEVQKMLTLSQLELKQELDTSSIQLRQFLEQWIENRSTHAPKISLEVKIAEQSLVMANPQALDTIMNNLFHNTLMHVSNSEQIQILLDQKNADWIELRYMDGGKVDPSHLRFLGNLFYHTPQSQGSGLGLYIIKQMMQLMQGKVIFEEVDSILQTRLIFKVIPVTG